MASYIDNSSSEINVVIIGETGTGKSTLINYLTNLFHNGSLTNLKVAIPTRYLSANMLSLMPQHSENDLEDITHRKTSQCLKYQYQVKQVLFNFYDTPGINDTGGYLADNENLDKIFQSLQSFKYLTALILVLNGTQARLTINIKNVLERFHDRIPDIFYSNIILILTNCTSHTVNFESVSFLNSPPIFYMQNSAFSSDPKTWTEHTKGVLQRDWIKSMETMNELIKTLLLFESLSTNSVTNMDQERHLIRSILHESRLMIMELQHIEDELIALEQASKIYSENIEKYTTENPTQTKTIYINEISITPYHNTICLKCNIVCHEQCSLTETVQIGEDVFRHCRIMDNGRCTICPGHCSYDMHYHDKRLIKSVPRKIRFAIGSLTNKYAEVEKEKVACEIKCKTVQEAKHMIEGLLQEQFNKVQDACRHVQCSCQGFNIAEELFTFINLLRNDMNSLRSSSVMHKATKFIKQLETLANDQSITLSEPIYASIAKRKSRNSRKRNQRQVTSTIKNDDSIRINVSADTTSKMRSNHIPSKVSLFDDDDDNNNEEENSFTHIETFEQQRLDFSNNGKFSEHTTEELIALIRQSAEAHALMTQELNRRCAGSSLGYLSPTQLLTLCEYYTSSRRLRIDELTRLHTQLQSEIQDSTDANPFEILSVPTDKLLRLTAIKLCLQNGNIYQ